MIDVESSILIGSKVHDEDLIDVSDEAKRHGIAARTLLSQGVDDLLNNIPPEYAAGMDYASRLSSLLFHLGEWMEKNKNASKGGAVDASIIAGNSERIVFMLPIKMQHNVSRADGPRIADTAWFLCELKRIGLERSPQSFRIVIALDKRGMR